MKRTRIKICGVTRPEDAAAAIVAGADAIGLVFWEKSSRSVTIAQAAQICAVVQPFVSIVALTVDASREHVENIITQLPITHLQFHGEESPEHCSYFRKPFIKAIRVKPTSDVAQEIERYHQAQGILLDTYRKDRPGGTGEKFDWSLIPIAYRQRIILAGGLNADNIVQAIMDIDPFAVDVSGGVESSAGVKDTKKINKFIINVRKTDQTERQQSEQ